MREQKNQVRTENVLMWATSERDCQWDYSNRRVSVRKKEWGRGRRNRAPLTEVRGVSSRRGGRGRGLGRGLISLLEARRLRLRVSDWLHCQAWCLAHRPEMCVLNHAMCADVTEMCKQIHVDVALQCLVSSHLCACVQCSLGFTPHGIMLTVTLHAMAPWWDCMSSLINLLQESFKYTQLFFLFYSTLSCLFSGSYPDLGIHVSFLSVLPGWKGAFFTLAPLYATPHEKKFAVWSVSTGSRV